MCAAAAAACVLIIYVHSFLLPDVITDVSRPNDTVNTIPDKPVAELARALPSFKRPTLSSV